MEQVVSEILLLLCQGCALVTVYSFVFSEHFRPGSFLDEEDCERIFLGCSLKCILLQQCSRIYVSNKSVNQSPNRCFHNSVYGVSILTRTGHKISFLYLA